jgi:hypothetical protein
MNKPIKKKCHTCFLNKELGEYRKLQTAGFNTPSHTDWYEANNCLTCEAMGERTKYTFEQRTLPSREFSYGGAFPDVKNLADSFECAFVGNIPIKRIYKTYKIQS